MEELPIPPPLSKDPDAVEVARIWIGLGDLHVSLKIGMYDDSDGPSETTAWGDILADTIRHVAHAIAIESGGSELKYQKAIFRRIRESLKDDPSPLEGDFLKDDTQ